MHHFQKLADEGLEHAYIHLYLRNSDGFDIRARMFSPFDGPLEDLATGSTNCALVTLLSHYNEEPNGHFSWHIAQGVKMGRPSLLETRTEKKDGAVVKVWIGGSARSSLKGLLRCSNIHPAVFIKDGLACLTPGFAC